MNDLVILKHGDVYTNSWIISENVGRQHRAVLKNIRKFENDLKDLGKLFSYTASATKTRGQERIIYDLNEQQAIFLMTLMDNSPRVIQFKKALAMSFVKMKRFILERQTQEWQLAREQLKPIRRDMTDVIQEMDAGNAWAYKQYTDLAYKAATGKIAKKLREERGANKSANAIDYMTADEIQNVAKKQSQIAVLRDMGMSYDEIKALITQQKIQVLK